MHFVEVLAALVPGVSLQPGSELPAPFDRLRIQFLIDAGTGSERDRVIVLGIE